MVYTNPAYLANLGRVGEIALCRHSRPDVAARLAGHQRSAKVYPAPRAIPNHVLYGIAPCHVIGLYLE